MRYNSHRSKASDGKEKAMPFDSLPQTNYVIEKLTEMKELLSKEGGWIKYRTHRIGLHGQADGYCLMGAAHHVGLDICDLADALGYKKTNSIHYWNDYTARTQEQVIKKLDTAIRKARKAIL